MKLSLKRYINNQYKPLIKESLKYRQFDEKNGRDRNPFQRDYSRILYSSSFRRLQGKMQLLGVQQDKFYRNRLTHSLEVAQIARGIAERLQEIGESKSIYSSDIYVVEAASLAHDIGNPPFGHHGERVMNRIMKGYGGFEGNAQTLRVLTKLEKKLPDQRGLNISKRTLLSVVKYFNKYNVNSKKFIYDDDYKIIEEISAEHKIYPRTLDAQIMDLADEIAYGAHDLEDALSINLFNIDEFLYEFKREVSSETYSKLYDLIEKAKAVANRAKVYGSSEEYSFLFRKELISNIVNKLILDVNVIKVTSKFKKKTGTKNKYELGFEKHAELAKGLKKLTFECINRTDIVQAYEKQGEIVIKGLFDAFIDKEFNKDNKLMPIEFRKNNVGMRDVSDFIAGMMDSYALTVYEKIYGPNSLEKIYDKNYFKDYDYSKFDKK